MEYEKAYVFRPDEDVRPAKRRRVEPQGLQASWNIRQQAYQKHWSDIRQRVDAVLDGINSTTVVEITTFLDDATGQADRIPIGIILTGPSIASGGTIAEQAARYRCESAVRRSFVSLTSGSGSNLKALLKVLIQKATSRKADDEDDEDDVRPSQRKGPKLLNYDLQLLADYVREENLQQVAIAFEGTEAFDSDLLSEVIELLGCWQDRIPFACLFSIATSVDFLQQRLSKAAIKCLDGRLFDVAPAGEALEQVFDAIMDQKAPIWIGPNLMSMTLERQSDYVQSTDSFVDSIQYAYMSAYYANALTIFGIPRLPSKDVPHDHYEAARCSDSFQKWARQKLDDRVPTRVGDMIEKDDVLYGMVTSQVSEGKRQMGDILLAMDVLRSLQQNLPNMAVSAKSSLYVQAMSGKLAGSAMVRSLLLTIRKQPSDVAVKVIDAIKRTKDNPKHHYLDDSFSIAVQLNDLLSTQQKTAAGKPLRSEEDVRNSTLRTTVVAQKVELSKQKSALSKEDAVYTALLRRFTDMLEQFFTHTLVNPKDLPFHEIFFYDLKSPHKEVFAPRPRHAVERALAAPHDYLACECCAPEKGDGEEATLAATQPTTAVLYQLYLESGNLINASDLWQAFQAVMGDTVGEEGECMALFQRGIAELKMLGCVKETRKRVDHVAKVAWRGL